MIQIQESTGYTEAEIMLHARYALEHAVEYFMISSEWRISLRAGAGLEAGTAAMITHDLRYMRATVEINLPYMQQNPGEVWGAVGHEVAHLVTSEVGHLYHRLPDEAKSDLAEICRSEAIEKATVRLERMFVRDCIEALW